MDCPDLPTATAVAADAVPAPPQPPPPSLLRLQAAQDAHAASLQQQLEQRQLQLEDLQSELEAARQQARISGSCRSCVNLMPVCIAADTVYLRLQPQLCMCKPDDCATAASS